MLKASRATTRALSHSAVLAAALIAFAAPSTSTFAADAPVQVEGQAIPAAANVAGTELRLNGVGVRAWTVYKMSAAALYLPKKATTVGEVVGQAGAKRVQLRILMSV